MWKNAGKKEGFSDSANQAFICIWYKLGCPRVGYCCKTIVFYGRQADMAVRPGWIYTRSGFMEGSLPLFTAIMAPIRTLNFLPPDFFSLSRVFLFSSRGFLVFVYFRCALQGNARVHFFTLSEFDLRDFTPRIFREARGGGRTNRIRALCVTRGVNIKWNLYGTVLNRVPRFVSQFEGNFLKISWTPKKVKKRQIFEQNCLPILFPRHFSRGASPLCCQLCIQEKSAESSRKRHSKIQLTVNLACASNSPWYECESSKSIERTGLAISAPGEFMVDVKLFYHYNFFRPRFPEKGTLIKK